MSQGRDVELQAGFNEGTLRMLIDRSKPKENPPGELIDVVTRFQFAQADGHQVEAQAEHALETLRRRLDGPMPTGLADISNTSTVELIESMIVLSSKCDVYNKYSAQAIGAACCKLSLALLGVDTNNIGHAFPLHPLGLGTTDIESDLLSELKCCSTLDNTTRLLTVLLTTHPSDYGTLRYCRFQLPNTSPSRRCRNHLSQIDRERRSHLLQSLNYASGKLEPCLRKVSRLSLCRRHHRKKHKLLYEEWSKDLAKFKIFPADANLSPPQETYAFEGADTRYANVSTTKAGTTSVRRYSRLSHTSNQIRFPLSGDSTLHTTDPSSGQYIAKSEQKRAVHEAAVAAKHVDGFDHKVLPYERPRIKTKVGEVYVRVEDDVRPIHHDKCIKIDDDDGHYIVHADTDLTERYRVQHLLGQGTFGRVVQAHDRLRKKAVAVKIARSIEEYRDASRVELRVLATLKAYDEANAYRCIHIRDCFDYKGHICIVTDLLGQSIFDFHKENSFLPFPNSQIQNFAHQLFTSVAFIHDLNLIHTDLKPENILLCDSKYQTFTYNRYTPSSATTDRRWGLYRRVLLDTETRLIDFGSATFEDEPHFSVVTTRPYRAPEIILGLDWSFPCDIWSIGCILVEFFTGDVLFQPHSNLEHLAMMEAVVGSPIDSHLVESVNNMSLRSDENFATKYFKGHTLDYPTPHTTESSHRSVRAMKNLDDIIPQSSDYFKAFQDFLKKVFVYDPASRMTAKEALNHPWFKEVPRFDDGNFAAQLLQARRRSIVVSPTPKPVG